jgi:hypothetical protein
MRHTEFIATGSTWQEAFNSAMERAAAKREADETVNSVSIIPVGEDDDPPTYWVVLHHDHGPVFLSDLPNGGAQ